MTGCCVHCCAKNENADALRNKTIDEAIGAILKCEPLGSEKHPEVRLHDVIEALLALKERKATVSITSDKQKRLKLLEKYLKSHGYDALSGLNWVSELEKGGHESFRLLRIAKQDFGDLLELKGIVI